MCESQNVLLQIHSFMRILYSIGTVPVAERFDFPSYILYKFEKHAVIKAQTAAS